MTSFIGMTQNRIEYLLDTMESVRVGIVGDTALDAYWFADMLKSELSRETPNYTLPVVNEQMYPGAGGNVAANMAALCPASVTLISVVGNDWRGKELASLLGRLGINTDELVRDEHFVTNAYIKTMRSGISDVIYEGSRLDFANYESISRESEERIITALRRCAPKLDILCVCDQASFGVITDRVRQAIIELAGNGLTVVADSRDRIGLFTDMIIKPNEWECAKAMGFAPESCTDLYDYERIAQRLAIEHRNKVFLTLGARGSIYACNEGTWHIPARSVPEPIDFCGAGDSSLSGFALALAAGAEPPEAAFIAGLCSEVTIRQLGVTGTASQAQLLDWFMQHAHCMKTEAVQRTGQQKYI